MDTAFLIFIRVLEGLFFIGLAGAAIVVAISFFEDIGILFERDKPEASHAAGNPAPGTPNIYARQSAPSR